MFSNMDHQLELVTFDSTKSAEMRGRVNVFSMVESVLVMFSSNKERAFMCFGFLLSAAIALVLASPLHAQAPQAQNPQAQKPAALTLSGDYPITHDPSIGRDGNTYYVFATTSNASEGQFPIRCSKDLLSWKLCGQVFDKIPDWIHEISPTTRDLWASNISFWNGKYRLYYAYSMFGVNTSGIGLATNDTLDPKSPKYHWQDEGLVLKLRR
jgi:beta-xylosidase